MAPFPSFDPSGATIVRGPAPRPGIVTNPQVHDLRGDGDPYAASQCDDEIRDGDVLLTNDAVAVLVEAWPVLVAGDGEASGFAKLSADADERWLGQQGWGRWFEGMRYFPKDGPPEGIVFDGGGEYLAPRGGKDYTASFDLARKHSSDLSD